MTQAFFCSSSRIVFVAALLIAYVTPGFAQNILVNPSFDAVLTPWTQFLSSAPDPTGSGTAPSHAGVDINNNAASGSALVDIDTSTPAGDAASGISQCVNFVATAINFINYGINVRVPTTTTTDASVNATVELRLFSNANCSGFITGGSQGRNLIVGLASNTTWYPLGDMGFAPPVPGVTAMSAEIRAYLREINGVGPTTTAYQVDFDAARLVLNSPTPVRLQSFDVE
jgi:hypothetical protein